MKIFTSRLFWGLVLIFGGVLFLLENLGIIQGSALFWGACLVAAGILFVVIDSSANVVLMNRRGCEILGCDRERVIGLSWIDTFIPVTDRNEERTFFSQLLSDAGSAIEYRESPVIASEGKRKIIAWHHTVLNDRSTGATVILSSGEDIPSTAKYASALGGRSPWPRMKNLK